MAEGDILYELRDGIAWITLNRPERMNALTQANMTIDLPGAWQQFNTNDDALVAVITAAGERSFCTGMDVRERAEMTAGPPSNQNGGGGSDEIRVSPRANKVEKPVICAVNGACAGIGMQIATDCDIIIAADNAWFADTRVSVGLMAALGSVEMSRMIPLHELLRMVMTGRKGRMPAERAYQIGMVSEVVPFAELTAAAERVARAVLFNAPRAVRLTKMAIWQGLDMGLADAIENAKRILAENASGDDMIEGMQAFAEKRDPQWKLR